MIAALPDNFAQVLLGALVAAGSVLIAVSSLREVVRRYRAEESFLKELADSMRKNFAQDKEVLEHAKEGELTEKEKVGPRETIYEVLPKLDEVDKASIERALKQPSPRGRENYEIKILSEAAHRALKRLETSDAAKETPAVGAQDPTGQAQQVAGQTTDQAGQAAQQAQDTVGQATGQTQDAARQATQGAQDAARRVGQQAQDTTGQETIGGATRQPQETPTRATRTDQAAVGGTVLSVLKFNDLYGADRVLVALQGLQEQGMITLEDAAVVSWPQGNRKPKTRQLHSTAGAGAGWGAFWGFLFGLIFFVPFLGAAIGEGMGGMTGGLANVGIDDHFIKEVREKVTEGTSALFTVTSGAYDKLIDGLKQYDFEIISAHLLEEQQEQLRETFTEA
jgi:uncharacterized membrane protein